MIKRHTIKEVKEIALDHLNEDRFETKNEEDAFLLGFKLGYLIREADAEEEVFSYLEKEEVK
jgi:hypothetical protein